ncbi:hypothetical protein MMC07_000781 [Pseudocyphellaria aurata]|nr:hypothetical protein [Pseudocyphellaria aurata]
MVRSDIRSQALFRALSTSIRKARPYDATPESGQVTPPRTTPSISQADGSSRMPPQTNVTTPFSSQLHKAMTSVMRLVPNSLTIILSEPLARLHSSPSLRSSESDVTTVTPHERTGLLVSSFNSITISPTPYVCFNIKLPSRTYNAILASGSFTASGINSVELAQKFIVPAGPKKSHIIEACTFTSEEGLPLLKSGQGGQWWMRCRWVREKSVQVGDHAIMVGEVLSAGRYRKRNERKSLFYLNGACRQYAIRDPGRRRITSFPRSGRERKMLGGWRALQSKIKFRARI